MEIYSHLKIYIVFSSSLFILEGTSLKRTSADINREDTDGEEFIKKIINGKKISNRPEFLLFTAPYRLCEGGCNSTSDNFVFVFPLYVGRKGRETYQSTYARDWVNVHSSKKNAPFNKKRVRVTSTPCPIYEITKTIIVYRTLPTTTTTKQLFTTTATTTITTTTSEPTNTAVKCPGVSPRACRKRKSVNMRTSPIHQDIDYNIYVL